MRLFKIIPGIFLVLFLSGCAANIKYAFDKDLYKKDEPMNYAVIVDVFKDNRPSEERDGNFRKKEGYLSTGNKDFKPEVEKQISGMLVEHLKSARIFKHIELKDVPDNLDLDIDTMQQLQQEGVDLAILGNLEHFYGYQSGSAGGAVMFGLVGVLTEAMINPKTVGANVEYSNVKIVDLKNKKILWQGDIEYNFEDRVTFYDSPVIYALRGLKKLNDKFCLKLTYNIK